MIEHIKRALKKYWGYDAFLPLQGEAIEAVVSGRDSVVVLPTGGGKSLCFQAPAVVMPGVAVVVSPLISLMKDQVDALAECGVPAARIDSSMSPQERRAVHDLIRKGRLKLVYLAPERLVSDGFINSLKEMPLSFIAVDEAHCVSMWGHDFRPEYRRLGFLKEAFGGIALHAYTATATAQVRADIAEQLKLEDPQVLVGSFDRPNLVYKVHGRQNRLTQVCRVLERHEGESGIIYCIRRADVDSLCSRLVEEGYKALPYHAGMDDDARRENQEAFIREEADTIVATIAFGMGIDKSNVRYVIHAAAPKSLEHYQQESGRAGRDGLEAECLLFYSGGDFATWRNIISDGEPQATEIALAKLNQMYGYCAGVTCRHRALINYFGQDLEAPDCGACDVCLGELASMEDSLVTAQKILSCVLRLKQRFGADYTASVLTGSREERILSNGHDSLSTYGLLEDSTKRAVRDWIEQLVGQGCIEKEGDYNILCVTKKGWRVVKGKETPHLLKPAPKRPAKKRTKAIADSWEGVDRGLFEALRGLRRAIAAERSVPAYVVFSDAALRDMARLRPSTPAGFLKVHGVGEKKCEQYAPAFLAAIHEYCQENTLDMD